MIPSPVICLRGGAKGFLATITVPRHDPERFSISEQAALAYIRNYERRKLLAWTKPGATVYWAGGRVKERRLIRRDVNAK